MWRRRSAPVVQTFPSFTRQATPLIDLEEFIRVCFSTSRTNRPPSLKPVTALHDYDRDAGLASSFVPDRSYSSRGSPLLIGLCNGRDATTWNTIQYSAGASRRREDLDGQVEHQHHFSANKNTQF
jgi:hypothetical protein